MANLAPLAKLVCHAHHKHRIPIGVLGKRMIDAVKVAQPVEAVTETLAHGELQAQVKPFFPLILHSDTHWQDYGKYGVIRFKFIYFEPMPKLKKLNSICAPTSYNVELKSYTSPAGYTVPAEFPLMPATIKLAFSDQRRSMT